MTARSVIRVLKWDESVHSPDLSPSHCPGRFLYVFVDKDRTGFMTATEFEHFLEMLHPYEKLR